MQTKDCQRDQEAFLGAAPEERARSHSRPRGRSRTTRDLKRDQTRDHGLDEGERTKDGVPADELWRLLDLMRINASASKDYTEQDLMDLLHMVVKAHKEDTLMDFGTFNGAGTCPRFCDYRRQCSALNLVKMEILEKRNARLFCLFGSTVEGRDARNLNKMLGDDVTKLMEMAHEFSLTNDEEERFRALYQ